MNENTISLAFSFLTFILGAAGVKWYNTINGKRLSKRKEIRQDLKAQVDDLKKIIEALQKKNDFLIQQVIELTEKSASTKTEAMFLREALERKLKIIDAEKK